jgi:hypothetical protein
MSATEDKARRVDVGFTGGEVLSLRMRKEPYESFRSALNDDRSKRWHEVKTEDSDVTLDLSQVVYVRLDTEQHKVGF